MNGTDIKIINKMHETISAMGVVLNEVASFNCHGRSEMNKRWNELERMVKELNKPPASITAEDVKRLRDHTGEGMMACKKALTFAKGNFNDAVEYLRSSGNISYCYTDQNRPAIGQHHN
jgi:phage-related protein